LLFFVILEQNQDSYTHRRFYELFYISLAK